MKQEISISRIKGVQIGQAENAAAGTGCTVFLARNGMKAGLDVRGGGPASRESELLKADGGSPGDPWNRTGRRKRVWPWSGRRCYEVSGRKGIGFDVGVTRVPLVCQSDLLI